ncbi:hypothetical protein [Hansschlegelia plantiphila]|uniref:Uncharacterized protein n=1 Tax=Hansschlegelia plantiphila TaxID=374655 RepID=A0A9W6IXL3_9HYPH|nr:hypothetical protein [Hansschlegelia plantiphila]GLK67035.1 hypothetical protein GCM10008179_06730 [Hansschlegelia plantiphila]
MSDEKTKPPYGTSISKPDEKAGVEVGGGDKAAAAHSEEARKESRHDHSPDDEIEEDDWGEA